jgi:hypothetical protein
VAPRAEKTDARGGWPDSQRAGRLPDAEAVESHQFQDRALAGGEVRRRSAATTFRATPNSQATGVPRLGR